MTKRHLLSFALILAVAVALTFFKVPLASSQGLTLVAAQVSGDLPVTNPDAALWQKATAVLTARLGRPAPPPFPSGSRPPAG